VLLVIVEFKTPGAGNEKKEGKDGGQRKKEGKVKGGWRKKGRTGEGIQEC
jgi:hypothetical protein